MPAAAGAAAPATAAAAAPPDPDPWLAADKLQHLTACAAVVLAVYAAAWRWRRDRRLALAAGVLASLVVAAGKELGDQLHWWPGRLSYRDLAADFVGTALGVAVTLAVHRPPSSSAALSGLAGRLRPPRAGAGYAAVPAEADRPRESGNTAHLQAQGGAAAHGRQQQQARPDLSRVGLVLWSSGFVLADWLLLRLPDLLPGGAGGPGGGGGWAGVRVLELGCGAGTVGLFLARAGAQVLLTDQAHVLPLTRENVDAAFGRPDGAAAARRGPGAAAASAPEPAWAVFGAGPMVVEYNWGEPAAALRGRVAAAAAARLGGRAPLPAAAAAMPQQRRRRRRQTRHAALLDSLRELCAPHTQVWLAYRARGLGEEAFEAAAADAGWVVEAAPRESLHTDLLGLVNGSLRMAHRVALRFIALREDFRTAKVDGKTLQELFSGEGMEGQLGAR
ncbi:hypothetical protein HT031_002476 [Scenedesmus sp. PABB004]|nr:hypothetical protein HT031_002476 [Scenedesmus sp. PABB004]